MPSCPALPHSQLLCQRQKTISGLFVHTRVQNDDVSLFLSMADMVNNNNKNTRDSKLVLTFLPHKQIKILATTKSGILLCRKDGNITSTCSYWICKPATKQWRKMPNPNPKRVTQRDPTKEIYATVVLKPRPNLHFKIVRFSQINIWQPPVNFRCEMFDSETSKWKKLLNIITVSSFPSTPPVSTCGGGGGEISWLLPYKQMFDFNLVDESWRVVALPCCLTENKDNCRKSMKLVEYKSQMALICVVA
ncbi:hypothetical protein FNV43_RR20379 [Rhamnella rubrinervis]|uniref:Uncharacterized protein n=1 Tax=Rhamnella rubrinervis TaxID=2594499 RepID=A0A8K0GUI6_9ROSA|nr:hypothetical protein FNV43_RR20379 [Rhamnella rubrinervis]